MLSTTLLEESNEWLPESDLTVPNRTIHIFTTAALPWRTGTSINALLRALYILKDKLSRGDDGKVHLVLPWLVGFQDNDQDNEGSTTTMTAMPSLAHRHHHHHHHRLKLYGPNTITLHGDAGKEQQTEWIRNYASQECGMHDEAQALCITYYDAIYYEPLGSIFPIVDLTSLVPNHLADVAILEEPEHLNWFQMAAPAHPSESVSEEESSSHHQLHIIDHRLAWKRKFRFVIGVIHTNYSAYLKQYGLGTALFTSQILDAMSSLVVRAYCHKIIRLSQAVPTFAPYKEICCNVHGVRNTFFHTHTIATTNTTSNKRTLSHQKQQSSFPCCALEEEDYHHHYEDEADNTNHKNNKTIGTSIYFVGKLLWAKGFDKILQIQNEYKKIHGDYFHMDIYGNGPDEKAIQRAFFGRIIQQQQQHHYPQQHHCPQPESSLQQQEHQHQKELDSLSNVSKDIWNLPWSLRSQLYKLTNSSNTSTTAEAAILETSTNTTIAISYNAFYHEALHYMSKSLEHVIDNSNKSSTHEQNTDEKNKYDNDNHSSMIHDLYQKIIETGIETSQAMVQLTHNTFKLFLQATFTTTTLSKENEKDKKGDTKCEESSSSHNTTMIFDPPQSLHEFRKNPIPAHFLGMKDHAAIVTSKIFLNPSITEVLCTTTAEALAMGKFVIIPLHPSNEFFYIFPNCLTYNTLKECVDKIQYALENEPMELTKDQKEVLTWEAATIRFYNACKISKQEFESEEMKSKQEEDEKMQWLHSEGMRKGRFIHDLFNKLRF